MITYSLNSEYKFNFELYGIICALKETKFAYSIEKHFDLEIYKKEDIVLVFEQGDTLEISNFLYEEQYSCFRILRNRSWNEDTGVKYIVPEMKQFDYLLLIDGEVLNISKETFVRKFNSITGVQFIQHFDINSLKSKENLIFE